ncbi:MAG: sugar-binding protein, partial [Armatimonadota bacterium]
MARPMGMCLALLCFGMLPAACQTGWPERADEVVCPRVDTGPTLDGRLDDRCWQEAALIDAFSRPLSREAPRKPVRALVCFDDEALYVAAVCQEPEPERIKTGAADGGHDVWKDDCLEVFVRTTDSGLEFDQFILHAAGARQRTRGRVGQREDWRPTWRGAAAIGADAWTAELVIPFSDLGIETPTDGYMAEFKLGREDHTTAAGRLSVWPPRAPYGHNESYGRLYFGSANLLANPDMSRQEGEDVVGWSFGEQGRALFASVRDGDRQVIRWRTPGRYATASQSLRLRPNSMYRLRALVRGTAGVYLRARTSERRGSVSRRFDVNTKPSEEYLPYDAAFPTGEEGTALIIIGNTEGLGVGEVHIADLEVVRAVGHQDAGPPIALAPGRTLRVTDVRVADCRALRGFVGGPVDGRLDSYAWNGATWEYGMRGAGSGVYYTFNGGDGLHVKLADEGGVDAIQIRNGKRVIVWPPNIA